MVHGVVVVQADERGIDVFGIKVAEKGSSNGAHALTVAALFATEGEAM